MLPRITTQQQEIPEYLGRSGVMGDFREVSNPPSHLLLFAWTSFSGQLLLYLTLTTCKISHILGDEATRTHRSHPEEESVK